MRETFISANKSCLIRPQNVQMFFLHSGELCIPRFVNLATYPQTGYETLSRRGFLQYLGQCFFLYLYKNPWKSCPNLAGELMWPGSRIWVCIVNGNGQKHFQLKSNFFRFFDYPREFSKLFFSSKK